MKYDPEIFKIAVEMVKNSYPKTSGGLSDMPDKKGEWEGWKEAVEYFYDQVEDTQEKIKSKRALTLEEDVENTYPTVNKDADIDCVPSPDSYWVTLILIREKINNIFKQMNDFSFKLYSHEKKDKFWEDVEESNEEIYRLFIQFRKLVVYLREAVKESSPSIE